MKVAASNEATTPRERLARKARLTGAPVWLGGVPFERATERACIDAIVDAAAAGRGGWVVPMNLDVLRRFGRDDTFVALIADAEMFVADGMPLVWASRLQGASLPERVAGSNMISSLSGGAAARGLSVYLLGGDPGTADEAASILKKRFPTLRVAGTYCPPMGFEKDPEQMAKLTDAVTAAMPDIVFVALGCPKQERLVIHLRPHLPKAWWMSVGISFSFLCGRVHRAPKWMQWIGLEWVHRLAQEPRRLARRYLLEGIPFAARLLTGALLGRLGCRRCSPSGAPS